MAEPRCLHRSKGDKTEYCSVLSDILTDDGSRGGPVVPKVDASEGAATPLKKDLMSVKACGKKRKRDSLDVDGLED